MKHWFPAKRHGWGWGPPVAWQGWVFLIAWVALAVVGSVLVMHRYASVLLFVAFFVPMLALLLLVCWLKGERPRWR